VGEPWCRWHIPHTYFFGASVELVAPAHIRSLISPATLMMAHSKSASFSNDRESATDVRLDGDEMPADADDGDAGHPTRTYMVRVCLGTSQ
jgi:hypothetical protein